MSTPKPQNKKEKKISWIQITFPPSWNQITATTDLDSVDEVLEESVAEKVGEPTQSDDDENPFIQNLLSFIK
jgi:hypothetical protein